MSEQAVVVQDDTRQQAMRKELTALIEAAAVSDPALRSRVTVEAVWQYMRLPESSYGWVPKERGADAPPPMPSACKALCVVTTLVLGLTPGLGHVLWLGNKCFIDIYGKRVLARRVAKFLGHKYRPMHQWEKDMFGLKDGDMSIAIEQTYKLGDDEIVGTGYGIIDISDFGRKPGTQSRKDLAMTVMTRAERDFLNRHFPIDGVADMPEDPKAYIAQLEPTGLLSAEATTVADVIADDGKAREDEALKAEYARTVRSFANAIEVVTDLKGNLMDILGVDVDSIKTIEDMDAATEVLVEWIGENSKPDPEPAKKKPGPKPKAHDIGTPMVKAADLPKVEPPAFVHVPTPQVGTAAELQGFGKVREAAVARIKTELERIAKLGGQHMKILGYNIHNQIDDQTISGHTLERAADLLSIWSPDSPSVVERNQAAKSTPPKDDDIPLPTDPHQSAKGPAPANRTEAKAQAKAAPMVAAVASPEPHRSGGTVSGYDMIQRALTMPDIPKPVAHLLAQLAAKQLGPNDHLYLPKWIRLAKSGGSLKDLEDLVSKRAPRTV